MKDNFLSKAVPRGTRTIWRYLSALILLFSLSIGQSWAADEVVVIGSQSSGALTIATNTHSVAGISGGTNTGTITDASDGQSVSGGSKMGGTSEIGSKLETKSKQHIRFTVAAGETVRFYYYQTGGANKSSTFATSDFSQSAAYYHAATAYNAAAKNTLYFVDFVFADAGTYAISLTTGQSVYMAALKFTAPAAAHTVTYKAGDGTGDDVVDSDAKTVKAFADCSFTAPSGYEFKEWQDGSSNVVAAGATVSADMTLTAIYRLIPTKYTVTYNLNGASGDAPTETDKAEGDEFTLASAPSWAGHAFDGWLCSADAAVKAAGSSYTMTAANTTFTALWHEVDCKIYSLTGGIGSAAAEADAGNVVIDASSLVLKSSNAIIKLTPGSGTFKAGDILTISGTVGNTSKNFGVKISASNNKGSGLGLASVAGTSNPMVATATLSADADYLYICRDGGTTQTLLTCEVHRSCAEGTAAGLSYAETEVNKTEGDAAFTNPLTNANSLVLDGYKSSNEEVATVNFSTGEVTIVGAGSATITANSAIQTKAGTLYAAGSASYTLTVAALPKYHVTYDLNGGSGDVAEVDHKAGEKFTLHDGVTGVTAPGSKTFVNWKDQDDALFNGGVEYTMPAKDVTLTAQWAGDVYTVKFMDGETVLDTKVVEVGSNPSDADIDKTKPLFAFAAWQKDAADIALDDEFWATVVKDASVTLTARWTAVYALDVNFKDAATQALGVATALNTYHYASDASDISFEEKGLKIKTNAARFYFNVAPGKVAEIKFGNISGATYSVDGGAAETLSTSQLKATYSASAQSCVMTMTTDAYNIVENVVIHDPYEVSYDVDGGEPVAAQYGYPSVTLPLPIKGTESFIGWFDGETKVGEAGEQYTPTANITLKAHWEAVSTDARLASITFSSAAGTLSPAFDPEVVDYTYTMPYPTAAVPTITGATSVSAKAQDPEIVSQAAAWNETAVIRGVAQSGDKKAYNITMKITPKDGVSIIKVATTGGTNKTVTGLYAGDGDVNLSSNTKMDKYKFIGFTLDGTTLQAGDRINVHTTTAANTEGSHIIFYDNMTDKNELYETGEIGGTGDNIFEINAAMVGATTAYVYRSDADNPHKWNGYVDYIEVTRAMNPVLTAITIDGRDGEIDALDDKHFSVTIPYESDLAALTVVPTIVRNAPHATTPEAVISNAGAWIEGDNTYRVMDKDGDYTDYTITLTRDVLKHTVSFNTHGGSAIDPVEVVNGQKLAAAPADPEKEDYIFQGWAETDGGAIVDVTSFTITAAKEFHAVWVADGAIKLLDGSTVNHTNFITGVTADETVEFQGNTVNYAKFSGTCSGVNSVKDLTRVIAYNATTNKTRIRISAHNNSTSARSILVKGLVEGASAAVDLATIALGNKEDKISDWIEFDNAANRTIYIMVSSSAGDVYFTQVKVVESGETLMKQAGEIGYSLNLNKGRAFGKADDDVVFEGLNIELIGDYTALNSGNLKMNSSSISFAVAAPVTLNVTTANSKTYYVANSASGTDNETAFAGVSEFNLTAGTWFINAGDADVQLTNIAFTAPKCEKPAIVDMSDVDLCENDPYTALTVSASVSDGGTLHYAWFKEAGATDEPVGTDAASFTPDADGEYYVIVTNQKEDFADNSETSNAVTVQHLAGTVITTAPVSVRKDAGELATLTVVAAGKNLSYKWYTCNADGSNAEVIAGEESDSYSVTITADMSQYYKVIVHGDCGDAEAIAKVEEWKELTQQDVTATTFWDFSKTGVSENVTIPVTEEEPVKLLANIPGVNNNELFRSDNIVAGSGKLTTGYIQTQKLSFHATVPGYITVSFSNTGNKENYRYLVVNGVETSAGSKNGTVISYSCAVPAGDVELTVTEADGGKMFNFRSLKFEKMDYYREIRPGYFGTICLPNGGKMYGAALYEVAYFDATAKKIFFDEIVDGTMVPGMPYIFQSEGDGNALAVAYSEETPAADALSNNGLYGSYTQEELTPDAGNYILLNNQYVFVNTTNVFVGANRAYMKIGGEGGVPTTPTPIAPNRRRISMGVTTKDEAQGFENLQTGDQPMKVMIDGTLYIIRGEKVFDATGRLVK